MIVSDNQAVKIIDDARAIIDDYKTKEKDGLLFNIFEILDRTTDEVKCHSAFIAELLDPKGEHGQSSKFLKLFFDCFQEIKNIENKIIGDNKSYNYTDIINNTAGRP